MLKRCIIAENRKLHASPIWVIFFVLPLISAGAESQLGMKFVSSSTFDALPQGGGTDNVVVSFKPSQKITNTMYNQYRTDGAVSLTFAASTRWDGSDEAAVEESVTAPGASYAKADYTAANGQVYQIYSVKDAAGNVTAQYAVFQHGATTYLLCAQSTGAMPQNYLNALLDTLNYPA